MQYINALYVYHVILLFLQPLLIHLLSFFTQGNANKYFVILEIITLYGIVKDIWFTILH